MEDKDLDRLFREAFNEAEETPSPKVWTNINANLTELKPSVSISSRANYWLYAAAAILIIGLGGYWGISLHTEKGITASISEKAITKTEIPQNPKSDNTLSPNNYDRNVVATMSQKEIIRKKEPNTQKASNSERELAQIEAIPESKLTLSSLELKDHKHELPAVRQVTEIDDIKPLIEFEEESETMLAKTDPIVKENKNIIISVLNKISEHIDTKNDKEIYFSADEEGSFGVNIINSIAKNRNKKTK